MLLSCTTSRSGGPLKNLAAAALLAALVAPVAALAGQVDATMIPDGTYTVKVETVKDASHIVVMMTNGVETTLAAKNTTNFLTVKPNDTLKISLIKGIVPVFQVQ